MIILCKHISSISLKKTNLLNIMYVYFNVCKQMNDVKLWLLYNYTL